MFFMLNFAIETAISLFFVLHSSFFMLILHHQIGIVYIMRYTLYIIIGVLGLVACGGDKADTAGGAAARTAVDTVPAMVMQIQKCSRLYTAEYNVRKIITHDDAMRIKGNIMNTGVDIKLPLGERKIAIPVSARLKAYIDFSQFTDKNIERSGDRITVVLPDPKVALTSSRVDHDGIKQYVSLTRTHFTDAEMTQYENEGRRAILKSIPELGIIGMAKENAARVLVPMLVQMGYKEENITVAFRKEYNVGDLTRILEKGTSL